MFTKISTKFTFYSNLDQKGNRRKVCDIQALLSLKQVEESRVGLRCGFTLDIFLKKKLKMYSIV